jgi:uncharacterized radical SAM superfamily Fe-S cluster-containing enzyme
LLATAVLRNQLTKNYYYQKAKSRHFAARGELPMSIRSQLYDTVAPRLRKHPRLKKMAVQADQHVELLKHSAAQFMPQIIQPNTRSLTIAITAYCNLRCTGCKYGRDFMPGSQLSWEMTRDLLTDAKEAGVEYVRLYGGEPLLHPDLPKMVAHAVKIGLREWRFAQR